MKWINICNNFTLFGGELTEKDPFFLYKPPLVIHIPSSIYRSLSPFQIASNINNRDSIHTRRVFPDVFQYFLLLLHYHVSSNWNDHQALWYYSSISVMEEQNISNRSHFAIKACQVSSPRQQLDTGQLSDNMCTGVCVYVWGGAC